jgi:hypothetical protein
VSPSQARAGEDVTVALVNTGTSCLKTSYGVGWLTSQSGTWTPVELNRQWPAAERLVQPGETFSLAFKLPDTAAGTYRVSKLVQTTGPQSEITADVTVVE